MHYLKDHTASLDRRQFLALGFPFFFWRRRSVRLLGARFDIVRRGHSTRRYLHIHGNEQTARQTLREHMKTHSGIAYLIAGDRRNVDADGGALDPNRMFSRAGAERSLRSLNPAWSGEQIAAVLDKLDRGRERLVRALLPPGGGLLLAVHNNSEGYSVRDEAPISDACRWRTNAPHSFLCTQARFRAGGVAIQRGAAEQRAAGRRRIALRLAAWRGVRYVNLGAPWGTAAHGGNARMGRQPSAVVCSTSSPPTGCSRVERRDRRLPHGNRELPGSLLVRTGRVTGFTVFPNWISTGTGTLKSSSYSALLHGDGQLQRGAFPDSEYFIRRWEYRSSRPTDQRTTRAGSRTWAGGTRRPAGELPVSTDFHSKRRRSSRGRLEPRVPMRRSMCRIHEPFS